MLDTRLFPLTPPSPLREREKNPFSLAGEGEGEGEQREKNNAFLF
jgi:hypothetical protein